VADDDILRQLNQQFRENPEQLTPEELEIRRGRELNEKEVKVLGVYQHPRGGAFVLLRDSHGRTMPIWIGDAEATSISMALEGGAFPRPMTHDLVRLLLERLGATVDAILIDDLYNNTYYAKLTLRQNGKIHEIDCRPSDAIAVALRMKAPIYIADAVLEEAQVEWREE
jgi:bifunctional DNase/RNase